MWDRRNTCARTQEVVVNLGDPALRWLAERAVFCDDPQALLPELRDRIADFEARVASLHADVTHAASMNAGVDRLDTRGLARPILLQLGILGSQLAMTHQTHAADLARHDKSLGALRSVEPMCSEAIARLLELPDSRKGETWTGIQRVLYFALVGKPRADAIMEALSGLVELPTGWESATTRGIEQMALVIRGPDDGVPYPSFRVGAPLFRILPREVRFRHRVKKRRAR